MHLIWNFLGFLDLYVYFIPSPPGKEVSTIISLSKLFCPISLFFSFSFNFFSLFPSLNTFQLKPNVIALPLLLPKSHSLNFSFQTPPPTVQFQSPTIGTFNTMVLFMLVRPKKNLPLFMTQGAIYYGYHPRFALTAVLIQRNTMPKCQLQLGSQTKRKILLMV